MLQVLQIYIYNCDWYENIISVGGRITSGANSNRNLFSTFINERNGNFQLETSENKDIIILIPVHGPLELYGRTSKGASDPS